MEEDVVALRCYLEHKREKNDQADKENVINNNAFGRSLGSYHVHHIPSASRVLVFDTETTADQYQNLLFGSCGIWVNRHLQKFYIFYADDLPTDKIAVIRDVAYKVRATVLSRKEFVENVFFQEVYIARTKCIGFNLKFDLSRLGIHYGESRDSRFAKGFSIQLTENEAYPRIKVKSLNTKAAFIEFARPLANKEKHKKHHFSGCFIDLRTVAFALTNETFTLEGALKAFGCRRRKTSAEEHGKVTSEYVEYNVNDTLSTYELYRRLEARFSHYHLAKGLNTLYSPASIGKAYLEKMGIKPFLDQNPDFPRKALGYVMTTYFGGRAEAKARRHPLKVTYLDFASMYPSVYVLLNMDSFLKADKISFSDTTEKTRRLVAVIRLENIAGATTKEESKKNVWSQLCTICKVKVNGDIFPVRSLYGQRNTYNIGVNHVTALDGSTLWYTLADVIASKLLTGRAPEILEAITFYPRGVQQGLSGIKVVGDIYVRPEEDFIKKLIIERFRVKKEARSLSGAQRRRSEQLQADLKVIANSTAYGIFIELNAEDSPNEVSVHGNDTFHTVADRTEAQGKAYNPIMATFITAGARLIVAAAEALLADNAGYLAYCDTDGTFVSPEHAKIVQDFFRPLNPFGVGGEVFKIEEDKRKQPLENVWLYAISAKRYCLYDRNEKTGHMNIRKFSSHGLGHLQGIDELEWWQDVLQLHYHSGSKEKILAKYEKRYAVSKMAISDYETFRRFKEYNDGKPICKQIKPFNFVTVGIGYKHDGETNKPIVPMLPFVSPKSKRFYDVPYMPFIDYKTGRQYTESAEFYWQPLSETFENFVTHSESKFNGDTGWLKRRHVKFTKGSIRYIGKETNELEAAEVIGVDIDNYTHYAPAMDEVILGNKQLLLSLKPKDTASYGIMKEVLASVKRCLKDGSIAALKVKTKVKLLKVVAAYNGRAAG